jgi:AAA family ATP:ADP antiporter
MLRVFTEVRAGEGVGGLALLGSVFLLLAANYFVKPARDGLLASSGVPGLSDLEIKAYTSFGQGILLVFVIPLYARLARTLERGTLIRGVTLFFISNLIFFWSLQPGLLFASVPFLGVVFYLWVGVFNVFVVAQFWAFAADLYNDEEGRRLFPAIAIGATAGSTAGAWMAKQLVGPFGTFTLLLGAAVLLGASLVLVGYAESRRPRRAASLPQPAPTPSAGALRLVFAHRYLFATAIVMLVLNWVKTNSDNLLFAVVQEVLQVEVTANALVEPTAIDRFLGDQTTAFYGDFFFWVNLASLLLQSLVASRVLKYGGFGVLLLALPVLSMLSYSSLALLPLLRLFRVTKIAEDSMNYSLHNTAVQVLWLPTTRDMKYQAKAAVDTIFVRVGDGLAALTAFAGMHLLGFSTAGFFTLNAVLAAAWLAAAMVVARENRRWSQATAGETSERLA